MPNSQSTGHSRALHRTSCFRSPQNFCVPSPRSGVRLKRCRTFLPGVPPLAQDLLHGENDCQGERWQPPMAQGSVLHARTRCKSPHPRPPYIGFILTILCCDCSPPPHFSVHMPHSWPGHAFECHGPVTQSMGQGLFSHSPSFFVGPHLFPPPAAFAMIFLLQAS